MYVKIFLDDERPTPEGWVRAYWPDEVIALITAGGVNVVSLDHDLGDDERGTGYSVLLWLEEQVVVHGMQPPVLLVHSANSSARIKMEAAIASIYRHAESNCGSQSLPRNNIHEICSFPLESGAIDRLSVLLSSGVSPSMKTRLGMTPLHLLRLAQGRLEGMSCDSGDADEMALLLVRAGADPLARDDLGRTPGELRTDAKDVYKGRGE